MPRMPRALYPRDFSAQERFQIDAGTEIAARPGQDADAQIVARVEFVHCRANAIGDGAVDRVALRRTVDRDDGNAVKMFDENFGV